MHGDVLISVAPLATHTKRGNNRTAVVARASASRAGKICAVCGLVASRQLAAYIMGILPADGNGAKNAH
jgi:hypothetical protein